VYHLGVNKKSIRPADDGDTAERLLDAAERLFGEHGYDGVGMRALAEAAKVNLGAATYHFGSKRALYIEAFMRRFRPANAERLRRLQEAAAAAKGAPLAVEKIVDCMIRPPFLSGLQHPDFHVMMARNLFMPPPFLQAALHKEIKPNADAFIVALRRSLPRVPEDLLHLRTMFSMGALTIFSAQMGRMQPARDSKFDESILRELVRFIAAGLQSGPAVPAEDRPPFPRTPFPRTAKPARV
jgi:AcrR family transcriptional regulator